MPPRLAVVGLLEVVPHIPRIWARSASWSRRRATASRTWPSSPIRRIFTCAWPAGCTRPGFPWSTWWRPQVWAWRKGRLPGMRRTLSRLLCIFPFEEEFFRQAGVNATYIGHPLAGLDPALAHPGASFFGNTDWPPARPLVTVLPGSRRGEAARHLPALLDAVDRLYREQALNVVLPASAHTGAAFFRERLGRSPILVIEGESWDAIGARRSRAGRKRNGHGRGGAAGDAHGDVLQGDDRPAGWSGRLLVDVPFYSMVNLIAGRAVVPELMQGQMTGERWRARPRRLLPRPGSPRPR